MPSSGFPVCMFIPRILSSLGGLTGRCPVAGFPKAQETNATAELMKVKGSDNVVSGNGSQRTSHVKQELLKISKLTYLIN